ncbi:MULTISPECIES: dipeptide epimerase [unclassified Tolypothrix]|uniref:dipeptide epimerase n=1 Tax=unclassified Tolypothrix TaxID=2649714 RepID=UPI0005EAA45A|nr:MULTISPECIES: dipeptide epimerase [unclassified Tolypothrix]BAY93943.1 mandelate racemase/muconate lactonizing protein [Microchaete diplosiphon NIES-3275]EKF03553.1 mandelate racemase / muconate lactonizing enzyme protein [Tolypothrix sp. PCC 7601]MBE9084847.1 dipeptide epimerase [Tolypothrix sp. LEGE 11397]UYD27721.1 dipeptide epimerase [Tolypothrix sp. PCC 7712]UYD36416.1 dipeptide epimerase [Tolypothrix sp. PCC 7601]
MQLQVKIFTVNKRFPLTISRGTTAQTTNVWVSIYQDGIEGWGEASPFGVGNHSQSTEKIKEALQEIAPILQPFSPLQRQQVEQALIAVQAPSAVRAAVDMAMHDWLGKLVGLPLWQLWGLDRHLIVPTSVTIGINSPAAAKARARDWLEFTDVRVFKVKLGSPDGIDADRKMFLAVREEAPNLEFFVDANGGWSLPDAIAMTSWLADLGIKYVEQPLPRGQEQSLAELKARSPLPIFVDESCFTSTDIPQLANYVDGINIKLMKSGGLTEAMRMVHTAKAYGLQVMFGCYSDSSLANTAAAQLAPLADYLDLDSHLNLINDPFTGALIKEGRVLPNDLPGLGVQHSASAT